LSYIELFLGAVTGLTRYSHTKFRPATVRLATSPGGIS
jgi:hypothetical protein